MAKDGLTVTQIARGLHVDRKTVRKYLGATLQEPAPFKKRRSSKTDGIAEAVRDCLHDMVSIKTARHKLTATKIHTLLREGKLSEGELLPVRDISLRTVQRLVKKFREEMRVAARRPHLKLVHEAGDAPLGLSGGLPRAPPGRTRSQVPERSGRGTKPVLGPWPV